MGVKTCSSGCGKNNPMDLNESTVSAKRRKQKKSLSMKPISIEATASMTLKKEDLDNNSVNQMSTNIEKIDITLPKEASHELLSFAAPA